MPTGKNLSAGSLSFHFSSLSSVTALVDVTLQLLFASKSSPFLSSKCLGKIHMHRIK